jgi:hypothetical protein
VRLFAPIDHGQAGQKGPEGWALLIVLGFEYICTPLYVYYAQYLKKMELD